MFQYTLPSLSSPSCWLCGKSLLPGIFASAAEVPPRRANGKQPDLHAEFRDSNGDGVTDDKDVDDDNDGKYNFCSASSSI